MTYARPRRLAVAFFLALGAGGCARAPQPGRVAAFAADTLALEPYFRALRTVTVQVGPDTLRLLLDTGGGASLLTPNAAARMGCRPYGRDVGHRMSGEPVVFQRCDSATVVAGTWQRRLAPIAVFDLGRLLPPELPHLDGILALDAFAGQVVILDWPAGRLVVRRTGEPMTTLGGLLLPTRPATGDAGRFLSVLVPVAGRRGPVWFLLDSGNLRGTLIGRQTLADSLLLPIGDSVDLAVGFRPPFRGSFQPDSLVVAGALGLDFFQRGPVALDLRSYRF